MSSERFDPTYASCDLCQAETWLIFFIGIPPVFLWRFPRRYRACATLGGISADRSGRMPALAEDTLLQTDGPLRGGHPARPAAAVADRSPGFPMSGSRASGGDIGNVAVFERESALSSYSIDVEVRPPWAGGVGGVGGEKTAKTAEFLYWEVDGVGLASRTSRQHRALDG